jgi:hypothetical protein
MVNLASNWSAFGLQHPSLQIADTASMFAFLKPKQCCNQPTASHQDQSVKDEDN